MPFDFTPSVEKLIRDRQLLAVEILRNASSSGYRQTETYYKIHNNGDPLHCSVGVLAVEAGLLISSSPSLGCTYLHQEVGEYYCLTSGQVNCISRKNDAFYSFEQIANWLEYAIYEKDTKYYVEYLSSVCPGVITQLENELMGVN